MPPLTSRGYIGDIDKAFELLIGLEYVGYDRGLPRLIASAKLERARLLLLQENMAAARDELDRADVSAVWTRVRDMRLLAHDSDDIAIGRLRWEIQNGDAKEVLLHVEEELLRAERRGCQRRALVLRMLQSIGLQRSGRPVAAMDVMAGFLRHTSREGFVRLILDEGEPVLRLVRRFQSMQQEASVRGSDPLLVAYLQKLTDAAGARFSERGHTASADHLMQPLSRKEIKTLEHVAAGASNATIAQKLGVSESTVRTHLRNVNTKLSARSRNEAVAIARRLDVIR